MKERMIHITGSDLAFNLCHLFRIYGRNLQLCVADCVMVHVLWLQIMAHVCLFDKRSVRVVFRHQVRKE